MPDHAYELGAAPLALEDIDRLIAHRTQLSLAPAARERIAECRSFLEAKLQDPTRLYYGINTGFGSLCNIRISGENTLELQHRLVRSHACGMGDRVPKPIVRLMLLLKAQNFTYGYSGVRPVLVEQLIELYNHDILPVIYELGSLGASGDLAPLAHLALVLIGEGEVYYMGEIMQAADALDKAGLAPISLREKEGLALLNGTQFSTAYGLYCMHSTRRIQHLADKLAALSTDAFDCRMEPLHELVHRARGHSGQQATAAALRKWLEGSEIAQREKVQVQDPYAFRCAPQVHGASRTAIEHVASVLTGECNAVTDNPNLFPEADEIISGGNFHAQPIALALDYLAIAVAELGSLSERRVYQLIGGQRGLPVFLAKQPGLDSGMMIAQYTAAGIVSQNKQLCTPASVDSIVSCNGQEDHVSMAANAGTKALRVVQNVERILAIELMVSAQALELRRPLRTSPRLEAWVAAYRETVPHLEHDRLLHDDMKATLAFLKSYTE